MERKIHFYGEPFMAVVYGRSPDPIPCAPIVIEDLFHCGLGIILADNSAFFWGPASPRDLIISWRGMEFLRRLKKIENGTLAQCYFCATREFFDPDRKRYIGWLIDQIGDRVYEQIMAAPIPEEIIRAILDGQKDEIKPALYPIIDEVRAGTIEWREEFAVAGIRHPDDVDAEKKRNEENIARYESLLASYAISNSWSRDCNGMGNVECALLALIEKGAENRHSMAVIVALAGAVGETASAEFATFLMPMRRITGDFVKSQIEKSKQEGIFHSAEWLVYRPLISPWWKFWRKKPKAEFFTVQNAKNLLTQLFKEYFPMDPESA